MDRPKTGSARMAFNEASKPPSFISGILHDQAFSNSIRNKQARTTFALLITAWFVVNLLQSVYTEIGNDEAYYWMYAQHLSWGYFDHPPLIAFIVYLGGFFFTGELGVRFLIIISQLITIFLIWKLVNEPKAKSGNVVLFFSLLAFIPLFQIYGFIATPDALLLLFVSVFLVCYSNFLKGQSLFHVFLLGVSMAGLLYSKYHGALVIVLVILSNYKLLKSLRFLMACLVALILLMPHLWWQIDNGYPTLQFQMVDRMKAMSMDHFAEFWLQQLVAFNPLILFFLLIVLGGSKIKDQFSRSLVFIVIGFFGFFWISSLWTRPEPHWTVAATIPAVLLLYKYVTTNEAAQKLVFKSSVPVLAIMFVARAALMIDALPVKLEFHGQMKWANEMADAAGNLPVAFTNSYQKPSVYSFYTGKPSFTLNSIHYHKNQYDLWGFEKNYDHKPVASFVLLDRISGDEQILYTKDDHALVVDTFISIQNVDIQYQLSHHTTYKTGELQRLAVRISNPYPFTISMNGQERHSATLVASFGSNKRWAFSNASLSKNSAQISPYQTILDTITFKVPRSLVGSYSFAVSLKTDKFPPTLNSRITKIMVKP